MSFDAAMFIVCILVINAFIFAAMRSPRICAIIFGTILAVPYFILGRKYLRFFLAFSLRSSLVYR
jgi:hypothetical protein